MNDQLLDLTGHTIVVTGGAGALGLPTVRLLYDHGADVAVLDSAAPEALRDAAEAAGEGIGSRSEPASRSGPRVRHFRTDLTSDEETREAFDAVEDAFGVPDIVCGHAGVARSGSLPDFPVADFDTVHDLNVRSGYVVASEAARRWIARDRPGHLIFTSSWVQDVPWPGVTAYAASKAAVRAMARGFARELAPYGIRANVVAPGIVDAGMAREQWDTEPDYRRRASRAIPLGRLQPPESVAHAFLFLCSPMASYMTGSTLLVDGGASLYPMDED